MIEQCNLESMPQGCFLTIVRQMGGASAVMSFNDGLSGISNVMENFNMNPGDCIRYYTDRVKGPYIKYVGRGPESFTIFSKKNCSPGHHRPKYFMTQ